MKTSELRDLIREEVRKAIKEAYTDILKGGTISGTGDSWPDVSIEVGSDTITLSQKIGSKTSKVLLNKKQFKQLKTI